MASDEIVPVPLKQAARLLEERYPEFAFSERQLRTMVKNGQVPRLLPPRGVVNRRGVHRSVSILVRVADLVRCFRSWERSAIH